MEMMGKIFRAPRRSVLRIAWRRRKAVAFTTTLAIVTGLVYITIVRPVVVTSAIVAVEILNPTGPDAESLSDGPVTLQPQIMQSKPVVATALAAPGIENLQLIKNVSDSLSLIESKLSVHTSAEPGQFELDLTSTMPSDAEKILGAIISAYIHFEDSDERRNRSQLESQIASQTQKLNADLVQAQARLADLQMKSGPLTFSPRSRELIARQRAELSAQFAQATMDATDAQAAYEAAKVSGDSSPAIVQKYESTQTRRAELQLQFDALEKQSEQLDAMDEQSNQLEATIGQLTSAKAVLTERLSRWNTTPENQISPTVLKPPQTSSTAVWQRPMSVLGYMAAGGFFLGIGLVWSKDRFSIWLQDSEDISMTATAPILGQLPMLPQELNSPNLRAQGVLLRPHDEAAKAVEHIRAELENRLIPEMRKTILITSPTSFQGKSMLASNLAISMARCGLRVALIDTNFRRPAINEIFGVDDLIGLSDAIEGKITIGQALRVTGLSGLEVMPAGYSNTAGAELLNRPQFAEVLNQLSKRFDRVVIDGDCARMDQCRILSSFCNATIMLVYSQGGRRNELVRAVDGLRAAGANVMGIVLNDLPRFRASARMKGQPLSASKSIHPEEAENPCGRAIETSQQFGELTDEIIDLGKLASDL